MSRALAQLLLGNNSKPSDMWRQGVVTAVVGATVSVKIGGSTTEVPGLRHFAWYTPTIGDVVHLLPYGSSFVVMGPLA